jgi:restriction endonuclease S subunit
MGMGKERVKLGSILKPVNGKKYAVSEGKDVGMYPLLRSSKDGKVKWMDTYEFEGPCITAGNGGEANFNLSEKFNASTHTLVYDVDPSKSLHSFIYYNIQNIRDRINDLCFQGSGLKNLSIPLFMDLEIPLPTLDEQQTLQSDFDEIRHKQAKISEYRSKAQASIQRLIPGAK